MPFSLSFRDFIPILRLSEVLSVVSFLLAVLFLAQILRSKRPPQSTIAWVLTVLLIPYIGVPLYIIFGGRKTRKRAGSKAQVYRSDRNGLSPGTGTERILRTFGVPPSSFGNTVTFLSEGENAFRQLVDLIDSATTFIHITTYILAGDPVGIEIVRRLSEKANRGVKVRLLIDDAGSWRLKRRLVVPLVAAGSRITATRVTLGAISLSVSNHFPAMPYSKFVNPVMLPPGAARLVT